VLFGRLLTRETEVKEFDYDLRGDYCGSVFRFFVEEAVHYLIGTDSQIDKNPDDLVLEVVLNFGSQLVILEGRLIKPVAKGFD
jgi:hypothetical protein